MSQAQHADVVVVGGGPSGSTLAWALARRGVDVVLVDRASFPREKVCGDFVDPRGVEILTEMGCRDSLESATPTAITRTASYVNWRREFAGPVPYYDPQDRGRSHGYTIPREVLDASMLAAAAATGVTVHEGTTVSGVAAGPSGVEVSARRGAKTVRYAAHLIAGADGVHSAVARSQQRLVSDPRRTAIARRAYAAVDPGDSDSAEIFFDQDSFPGYGWMFSEGDARVNLGIGILSETRERAGINVPTLFRRFIDGLRRHHPRCSAIELASKPIGGTVRTYGGAGSNHFDGGVLIGDAGSFVDPMTGEGITHGMESAVLAARTLLDALRAGDFSAGRLAGYERAFRARFDPSMLFQDLCAIMLRNRHLSRPWLKALARGCHLAQTDAELARTSGSFFGGLEIRSLDIIRQVWAQSGRDIGLAGPRLLTQPGLAAVGGARPTTPGDLLEWQTAMARSALSDPRWHARWLVAYQRAWIRFLRCREVGDDPRVVSVLVEQDRQPTLSVSR